MTHSFYAKGKLLISGEYFVLDGATALALPCKFGQRLEVETFSEVEAVLHWRAFNHEGKRWFKASFSLPNLYVLKTSDAEKSDRLKQILEEIARQNPSFFQHKKGIRVNTYLEFPENWGLGSSSTLLDLFAQWASIDPYELLKNTFGGSGYDLACARAEEAIFYTRADGKPIIKPASFKAPFKENLYFLHLNKKQNSREGIAAYRNKEEQENKQALLEKISSISQQLSEAKTQEEFENLLKEHEQIVGNYLGLIPVQEQYFSDFQGTIKSLGAWGGDFVLVASHLNAENTKAYFEAKGFTTLLPYQEMVY